MKLSLFLLLFSLHASICTTQTSSAQITTVNNQPVVHALLTMPPKVAALKDSFIIKSDNPNVQIIDKAFTTQPKKDYDPLLKDILVFEKEVGLDITINNSNAQSVTFYIAYQDKNTKKFFEQLLKVQLQEKKQTEQSEITNEHSEQPIEKVKKQKNLGSSKSPNKKSFIGVKFQELSTWIENLVKNSNSLWLQLLAVFLLGILMSLTPCIYPMIPITAGILQSYGSKSFAHNLFVSVLYALGIATTFSAFGLISATTGQLFGNLLVNPIFVIFMVLVLGYMALTMLGFVEFYTPSFMQNNGTNQGKKSIFSAFTFGVISGSVASPCLTPGLALLLTIVAALGNKFLGFLLLFTAGIGLSVPMIIIGTFSSSLALMPRAGMWMVEIKKLFGFILFAMCIYFLSRILPVELTLALAALFCLASGIYYFISVKKNDTKRWKFIKNMLGIIFVALAVVFASQGIQEALYTQPEVQNNWETSLDIALADAKQVNKKIFIDITGEFCSICKAIEKKILNHDDVKKVLEDKFIKVKIDASKDATTYDLLKDRYKVIGVPTLLAIDADMNLVGRWASELYGRDVQEFAQELEAIA